MNSLQTRPNGRLAVAICLALAAAGAHAATITVDSSDDDVASTFCNLRDALTSINNGAATPTCTSAVSGGVFGDNDTILFSGTLANATITLTQGELGIIGAAATITGGGQIIDAAGNSRAFVVDDLGTAMASNLTFTNGHSADVGGAIQVANGSSLTLDNCSITNSSATTYGGGVYVSGTATINNSTISGNSSTKRGGGIYAKSSMVTLDNTTVSTNLATTQGGGVYTHFGQLTLNSSIISNNVAQNSGGGVTVAQGGMTIDHSTISGNSGIRAGGIYPTYHSNALVTASRIEGNSAYCSASLSFCGGGIYSYNSSLDVTDSTITGNIAKGAGNYLAGGAYLFNSTGTFVNFTITANSAMGNNYVTGGLWELHGAAATGGLTLTNTTISANTASSYIAGSYIGGGVQAGITAAPASYAGTLSLANTIVSGNSPTNTDVLIGTGTTTLSTAYNLLGTAQDVSAFNDPNNHNLFSDAPGLGPLQNNGGATETMALSPTSPALRAGSIGLAAYSALPLNYDQRGISYVRTFSGTVDIGAFEDQGERIFANGVESEP